MTGDDELRRRLEELGDTEPPEPDAAFAQALEADLRSAIHFRPQRTPRPSRRPVFRPALVIAAALLVAGLAFLLTRGDNGEERIAVESASDTELTFSDGSTEPAGAGRELPDGTRISVGPDGSAVIDDVVLGAGDEAVIVDGVIEVVTDAALTPTPAVVTDPAPTATQVAPTATPGTEVAPTATPVTDRPTVTDAPTPTPLTDRRPTPAPVGTPVREPTPIPDRTAEADPTPEPTAEPTSEPSPVPVPFVIELTAEPADGDRLRLVWSSTGAPDDLGGWEVIALVPDGSRTVAVIRDLGETELTVSGRANGYQVVARGKGGRLLAESNVWQLTD